MITNPVLEEKYKVQKQLDEKANHDLKQYFANSHQNVKKLFNKYGKKLYYGNIEGGFLEFVYDDEAEKTVK
ncbi:MAG: hypothetical protein GXO75_18140 [Calditrichaeota bacterium]|nr:hypothetical protein [Calditrichota bacterium]